MPYVTRIAFSIPASSAQIERDFGVSGMMLTCQRTSMSAPNVDMCSFINRNQDLINIGQCEAISTDDVQDINLPSNIVSPFDSREVEVDEILSEQFSATL